MQWKSKNSCAAINTSRGTYADYPPTPANARGSASGERGCEHKNHPQQQEQEQEQQQQEQEQEQKQEQQQHQQQQQVSWWEIEKAEKVGKKTKTFFLGIQKGR